MTSRPADAMIPEKPLSSSGMARASSLTGTHVIDDRGTPVGTVSAVVYEDREDDPAWLVVESRWLRRGRYVPVDGSYPTAAGDLVVPFEKSWVMAAPKAEPGDVDLSYETRRQLATHYGDTYDWWPRRREPLMVAGG